MNRTDRLLAIVLELQARGKRRAEDLAATFEVGKRTIYRDVQALCEAGVPVISTPGQGYSLVEGYFLPPLRFTPDEALMLLLGGEVMAQSFDAEYAAAAQSAGRKIIGVLPEAMREQVRSLQQSIRFIQEPSSMQSAEDGQLRQLRRAIVGRHSVRFQYHARSSQDGPSTRSRREADPYGLVFISGGWHVVAFDHTRRARRNFRVSRMSGLIVLAQEFERPAGFVLEQRPEDDRREVVVRALCDASIADWVRESRSFFVDAAEPHPDGLLVTLRVRHERDAIPWLLGWGAHVRVLEPASVRALLAAEAEQIVRNHAER
jgi:predicted DNA-binding transcriptional regulator YafY